MEDTVKEERDKQTKTFVLDYEKLFSSVSPRVTKTLLMSKIVQTLDI